jgi:ubiquinone/menaquinone biosynthesis C-methylase UbiE
MENNIIENQKKTWEESYLNRDNFVFYPHEEVIRFVSKYIRKRIGLCEYKDVRASDSSSELNKDVKILDLGCGIGRHVIYCHEMGLEAHGIDLSETAISVARMWATERGISEPEKRIRQGDISHLPYPDEFFNFALCHGVLDSMSFPVARLACSELARVLKRGGLFYCDLVSGDDSNHAREYCGEEIVSTSHEKGTIQSYFNFEKMKEMTTGLFEAIEALLVRRENVVSGGYYSRYHIVLRVL